MTKSAHSLQTLRFSGALQNTWFYSAFAIRCWRISMPALLRLRHLGLLGCYRQQSYERLKRGEFEELENLRGLGHLLISIRIAQGVSQRELARRLDVHESQVSRDERNEYFGITLERAIKILDALDVRLRTKVESESLRAMAGV